MAIKLPSTTETFKVALRIDDALSMTAEEYSAYLKTCDVSALKLVEGKQPTFFILRKALPHKLAKKVMNEQVRFVKGEAIPELSFIVEHVRAALCGVENPPDVSAEQAILFKPDDDGGASEDLMTQLIAIGAHTDLFSAHQSVVGQIGVSVVDKKN